MAKRVVHPLTTLDTICISVPEFAAHMGVHRRTVRKWIDAGLLPAMKIGAIWRIDVNAASAFIRAHRVTPVHDARVLCGPTSS